MKTKTKTTRPNPSRIDPTGTATQRKLLENEIVRRMRFLQKAIHRIVVVEDSFGLRKESPVQNFRAASTQVNIDDSEVLAKIRCIKQSLDETDVLKFDDCPHVTVRFGLDESISAKRVKLITSQHRSLSLKLKSLSLFENEKEDVLKIDVESRDLSDFHDHLGILPNRKTHQDYKPHLTIAYLKPGTGRKYIGRSGLEDKELRFDSVVFSDADRNHTILTSNAFCPTGKGGGRDNSCSPKKRASNSPIVMKTSPIQREEELDEWAESLDGEEENGLIEWVDDSTYIKRFEAGTLITNNPERHKRNADSFNAALDRAPTYEGVVYRGETLSYSSRRYQSLTKVDSVIELNASHSATRDPFIAKEFTGVDSDLPGNVLMRIRSRTGVDISSVSRIPSEAEVVLRRGSKYRVTQVVEKAAVRVGSDDISGNLTVVYLEEIGTPMPVTNAPWQFLASDSQLAQFMQWLKTTMSVQVLGSSLTSGMVNPEEHWLRRHISDTFLNGMGSAFDGIRDSVLNEKLSFYQGTRKQFLQDSFFRPVSQERVKLLASRALNELSGVTDAMATKMQRTLVDGFIAGDSPFAIAKKLSDDVETLGISRARTIARTEVIRAHNEGQLDAMSDLGVTTVGVAVEWSTSGLGKTKRGNLSPCPRCAAMKGVVLSIQEARGKIPMHPNCMCSWIPANVGEKDKDQVRSVKAIQAAVDRAVKAERPKSKMSLAAKKSKSSWIGAKMRVSKKRPKSLLKK